jgi:SAM-dependent methyltransferase
MNLAFDDTRSKLRRSSIPDNETVHYEAVARQEIEALRSISSITQVHQVSNSVSFASLANIFAAPTRGDFPEPRHLWLSSTFECAAEYEAFKFIAPIAGKTVLQVGGKGTEAVRMILAGAKSAHLVSPVQAELDCAHELARLCGVTIESKLGLAENLPYANETFDVIYAAGSAHHFETKEAFPEIYRALRNGGRFAAIDPWLGPFYKLGIRIFGKREKGVNCRPLDKERLSTFGDVFRETKVQQFGTFTRYPMIAVCQMGWLLPLAAVWWFMKVDDSISTFLRLRQWGSCAAILAEK